VTDDEPWGPTDSRTLPTFVVVVAVVGGVVAFLLWLNHFIDGIGF
jgi:preprotein translocase subunit SecE